MGAIIPATNANVLSGLSPYNWVRKNDSINSTVNGASITLKFEHTRRVVLQVATDHLTTQAPTRFPIIAWSVNGGAVRSDQLARKVNEVVLSSEVDDPQIELYLKGMSPFEDRFAGDLPGNSLKVTGFSVDAGGKVVPSDFPAEVWLNIGDSILSGDGAEYAKGQGRPPEDAWAKAENGRASYGYLLAHHYGYRESRIAYGGYNWGGGLAGTPALETLIDQTTTTVSRLVEGKLKPVPAVVMVNLGENGKPAEEEVVRALLKLRSRVAETTEILVTIPISGTASAEVKQAFDRYQNSAKDKNCHLVDLGKFEFDTCDGQHPTAAGHHTIFDVASPVIEKIIGKSLPTAELNSLKISQ
jgi:hypothetical protein